jgi:hypothetical protein
VTLGVTVVIVKSRRIWGAIALVCALVIAGLSALLFLWSPFGSGGPEPWPCDRGFRAEDWRRSGSDGRVRTGRAIAECGWMDGRPADDVLELLGSGNGGSRPGYVSYQLGNCDCGLGPTAWFLVLRFGPTHEGVVTEADAATRGI